MTSPADPAPGAAPGIVLTSLTKRYGRLLAVDDLSFSIPPGEILGLLGPNGAGKTTTLKMLTGLLIPTSGTSTIMGYDILRRPQEAKRRFGYVPDRPYVYEKLTGREFLLFMSGLYGVSADDFRERSQSFLEMFELTPWQDELIEGYSHGMRQKLVLTGALLHRPPVLIIDEPMVGLDPKGARLVKDLFVKLAGQGTAILLSTHSMELAERVCHRIAILQHGRLRALDTFAHLQRDLRRGEVGLEDVFLTLTGSGDLQEALKGL